MSWQAYVDTSLIATHTVDKAAIYDASGRSPWAASSGFVPKPEELATYVSVLNDSAEGPHVTSIRAEGVKLEGKRYVVVNVTDRSIYGRAGKEGIVITKTKQAILITHQPDTVGLQQTVTVVESLADYLIGLGF